MIQRKIPLRTCVVSKEKLPKQELVRVVRDTEEHIQIDLKGKMNGRGAYLKKDKDVIEKARKSKALERHLGVSIPNEIYDELLKVIDTE